MRDKKPKVAMLLKRLMGSIKDLGKTLDRNTAETKKANQGKETQHGISPEMPFYTEVNLIKTVEIRKHTADTTNDNQYQKRTLLVSWLSLGAVVAYATIAAFQWCEMSKATKATQDAAVATQTAATAAQVAAKTNQSSLEFAKDSFHVSERPYVTISSITFDAALEPDKETGLSIIADNSGHTPALRVAFSGAAFVNGKIVGGKFISLKSESVIPSQHQSKAHYLVTFGSSDINDVISNSAFKIEGTVRYVDIFNESHPTTFCAIYDGKEKLFKFCSSGNDVK